MDTATAPNRPYMLQVGRFELQRILSDRMFLPLPPLLILAAMALLYLRANWIDGIPLGKLLMLGLLLIQALLAPLLGGGLSPTAPSRHRIQELLLLTTRGPGSYLVGIYLARVLVLLTLGLVPLPVWLLGSAPFPDAVVGLDFWLVAVCGPFVFCALVLFAGQVSRSEVLGFLTYSAVLCGVAVYLWGLNVAPELTEIRPLVLIFLLWLTWAGLLGAGHHFALTLAERSGHHPPDAVHHVLGGASRKLAATYRRIRPAAFDDPLQYLHLFRPPTPPIGMAWLITIWLIFIALVLDAAFAILPYRLTEAPPEALQAHLWLVTACLIGALMTPAALGMASFHGREAVHDLLRMTPYTDREYYCSRERAVMALSLPLSLLPFSLQLAFTTQLEPACRLGLLCLAGQFISLEVSFMFCQVKRLGEGLFWIMVSTALIFGLLPALGRPTLEPALLWARATLPGQPGPSLTLSLASMIAGGLLLARYNRLRFRLPTVTPEH